MSIEGFTCNIQIKPMMKWLKEDSGEAKNCHICRISPLASYYAGTLKDAGVPQLKVLEEAWTSGDGLTIAEAMDRIKAEVGEPLRKELEELDCFAQSFKEEVAE